MIPNIIQTISEPQAGRVTLSILVLLCAALLGGKLVTLVKIPKVAGEILGGIIVGPTILGYFFPDVYVYIFDGFEGQGPALSVFYWLGLIMLMFSSGYDSNIEDAQSDKKIVSCLAVGATILPFLLGYYVSNKYFVDYYIGDVGNRVVFNLVFSIAIAVTSLPVISKIFMDLGLIDHRFARIILATATIQDLFLWIILSIATSVVSQSSVVFSDIIAHVVVTLAMFCFAVVLIPQIKKIKKIKKLIIFSYDSIYFILCFGCIYIGSIFSVNIMYSSFVAGMIFRKIRSHEAIETQNRFKNLCLAFFTPIYFAIVGLKIHITGDFSVLYFLAFILFASSIELIGCVMAMRLIRLNWLASFNLGIAMNARGGPGIVLATVTYAMGIINYDFFCVLVFTSLITSALAGWWIDYINGKGKLLDL